MPSTAYLGLADGGWRDLAFAHFREGVDIHWLHQGGEGEPSAAVLKYAPGARVPLHHHDGLETIVVLDGVQSDERGDYAKGTVVFNPAGTQHSVWSTDGCVVLIHWDLPVRMAEPE